MLSDFVTAALTWTLKLNVPAAVGVPEMAPALSESPVGSVPVTVH